MMDGKRIRNGFGDGVEGNAFAWFLRRVSLVRLLRFEMHGGGILLEMGDEASGL